ncbi:SpaA isopeptide-forming pilin-related protein [Mediannikoviicoccus vaginalis]|uniref:SpaA isopeptide-forming pilin-related protein n=1 Tax=Mediannikoviicoccus vaginalis TaxID=2899727 RepID=UPI001F282A12|nr:SpaA isopeptide-forming pilin-related protein [Mediannikoviicoccus vaginalis]
MNSKTFRRISSGLLSLILVLQVLVQPVMAVQNTNDLPTETKTEEMKNDAHSETIISPAVKKKLSPLELNYVNRLEDDSFAFLRGPFVMSSEEDFDIKDYTFVEKDEKGKVSIIKGENLEEFSNIDELNKIIKEYRENYELYKEEKLQELEPVEVLLTINYKEYDELSVPLVINDLENKYESTKNETLTLKRDEEELTKEIFVNSYKDLEELLLSFKGEEEVKDLDIIKVEKVYSGEEDEDTITVEKVFEEVLEEAHEDENKVTSLNLDELDPGYKYIFTLESKQVKDDNKVLTEITSLEKDQEEKEVEELGKTIVEEETEAEEATEETKATEATEKEETKENVQETKEQKEKTPQENKIDDKKEVTAEEDEKVQEFEKALEETKEEIKQDPNNKEEKKGVVEGIKKLFGLTDLQKADKELKAALKDEKNGLEEIQKLLNSFEEKYNLSREEQLKLMDDNGDAIKALIAKDADENFRPSMLLDIGPEVNPQAVGAGDLNLEGKKFNVRTIFQTSNINGPIQDYQYFKIHLDDELTVNDPSSLPPIIYNQREIAIPSYDKTSNVITYKMNGKIPEKVEIPLNIPVDYNPSKITLDKDGTFTVTNKVTGLGVTNPKDLIPTQVNKNGEIVHQIIESGRNDVTQIVEPDNKNYKVYLDGYSTPHIEDKQLKGYYWTFKITSNTDLKSLGYKANFTTVKGSGLGDIEQVKMNGKDVELTDQLGGNLGIVDSKHHNLTENGVEEITYTFYTKATDVQAKYMMDFSLALTNQNKVGAKRFIVDEGYNTDKISDATPNRVGMNNRTTIFGEFTSNTMTKWTVTDAVSTGDTETKLPLETRKFETNKQELASPSYIAVYGLDNEGKMVAKKSEEQITKIPEKGTNPNTNQDVGTIAVYEYKAKVGSDNDPAPLTLGGVAISRFQDIYVNQEWSLAPGTNMPEQTIKAGDARVTVPEEQDQNKNSRKFTIPNVKVWSIDNGKATKTMPKVVQDLPKTEGEGNNAVKYYENTNYFGKADIKEYFIHNRATKDVNEKLTTFSIVKIDKNKNKDGTEKKLPGATFKLLGANTGTDDRLVTTDSNGKAKFSNILPGSYTLVETNAPAGYKVGDDIQVTVDNQGGVNIGQSPNATLAGGKASTGYAEDQNYPDYMNASFYGTVDNNGKTVSYIYLHPKGGTTNRDTRISLVPTGGSITNVEMFDVDPNTTWKNTVYTAMENQTVDKISNLGINVINEEHWDTIKGQKNFTDRYTGDTGYQIKIPKKRMENEWGFLIKVEGQKNADATAPGLTFNWLTDGNNDFVKNNAKIQTSVTISGKGDTSESVITITNESFKTRPVQVDKIDQNKDKLQGARFKIMDEKGEVIKTVGTDSEGRAIFGEMPEGKYVIEEESAPDGYLKSNIVFDVTVDSSNKVSYKARFKDGKGTPVNGYDYIIENEESSQNPSDTIVTNVKVNKLEIWENEPGDIGIRPGVWEAYRYESLKYNADIDLSNVSSGSRLKIQFDPNLDFTQYVNDMPKAYEKGVVVAEPYFDYNTNTLTYVFNDNVSSQYTNFKLEIKGIIPSKFYAQNNGTYYFTNVVEPGKTGVTGFQSSEAAIPSNYETYDTSYSTPAQSYYFRDVYQVGNEWYVTAIAYYNPLVDSHRGARTLKFNWSSTKRRNDLNIARWPIEGEMPAFKLQDVKVYRVLPSVYNGKLTNEHNMPLSFGIRPDQDPGTYTMVYSRAINPDNRIRSDKQGNITLDYDPDEIKSKGTINSFSPLRLRMPAISGQDEGYVIEQTFKVTDMPRWKRLWRTFYMTNGNLESAFTTKVNENRAIADQTGKEVPKFYIQKVKLINKKYTPGNFTITKRNDADRNTLLQGAVFSLTGDDDRTIYRTTDQDGKINFTNLRPGNYRLEEVTAPEGYSKVDSVWQINVNSQGVVTITETGLNATGQSIVGNNINIDITNKPTGTDFNVYKKDDENKPLKGAKFTLTKQGENTPFATGTSDENGKVTFDRKLEKGTYILQEIEAPSGYKKLDKKWVVEVTTESGKNKAKIYNYVEGKKEGTDDTVNQSLLGDDDGTKWVDVAHRPLTGWDIYDNRWGGYVDNRRDPYKMGTRIIGINKDKKYVIQRYIINPEKAAMDLDNAIIHREKPWYNNMTWYAGTEDIKAFILKDGPAVGNVEDLRLGSYSLDTLEINTGKKDITTGSIQYSGNQKRMTLNFSDSVKEAVKSGKPLVIDVKVPYTSEDGGVGTGMDLTANNTVYWKSDYYESVGIIPEGDLVKPKGDQKQEDIKGGYISEDSLDVSNTQERYNFRVQKVKEKKNDSDTADAISGATFKLQGPKPSRAEKWEKSDKDGYVKFKDLTPGVYTLKETGPALGYEYQDTTWTVTVTKEGKIYFRDNNPGGTKPQPSGPQWQEVNDLNSPNAGRDRRQASYDTNPYNAGKALKTYITEVDIANKKFKQVFILNKARNYLDNPELQIHSYPEDKNLSDSNTKILSIKEVGADSEPDKIVSPGNDVPFTHKIGTKRTNDGRDIDRIVINTTVSQSKTLMVEVESSLPNSGAFGLGMDFINRGTAWGAEKYNSINDVNLEPLPENKDSTGKDRSYYLADGPNAIGGNTSPIALATRSMKLNLLNMTAGLEIGDNLVGNPVGASNISEINYDVDSSNATIKVNAGAVDTTDGTRTINVSVKPKESGNTGLVGKNLQYVFMIDRSRDAATNIKTADTPTIDKNINKFLTDLAEKAKANNANIDITFIEYSKSGAKVLGSYNQDLMNLYNSANSFTYNMKTNAFNDRNNVTAKDILGKVGISARPTNRNSTDDGSQVLNGNINNYYNNIVGNGKKYDKRIVLNVANFDVTKATYYLPNSWDRDFKKYYIADNNWPFRDPGKQDKDKIFDSYILHIEQKSGQWTNYEEYMGNNSGTWKIEKDTSKTANGIYSYKGFLESNLMKDEYLKGTPSEDANIVNNASINIGLTDQVKIKEGPSANYGNINNTTTNGFNLTGINLKKGQILNLSYTINLKNTASDNTDYTIHNVMKYKPDQSSADVNLDTTPGLITKKVKDLVTVTFDPNGGQGSMEPVSRERNTEYELPANTFTHPQNLEFKGWDVSGQIKQPGEKITLSASVKIKATWGDPGPAQATITFSPGEGSGSMESQTVEVGTSYKLPQPKGLTPPTDKVFDKWDVNGTKYDPGQTITVNGPTTVTATWKEKPYLTVTIAPGQGSGTKVEIGVKQGGQYTLKTPGEYSFTAPTGDWEFDKWSIDGVEKNPGDSFKVNKNTTVYATWKKSSTQQDGFKVTFGPMSNGSVSAEPEEGLNEGEEVTLTVSPDKGYVLDKLTVGNEDVTSKVNDYDKYTFQMPKSDVEVKATFKEFVDPLINFKPEDGKDILINGDTPKLPQIINRQVGIELKLFKKNREGLGLPGGKFKLSKTDANYQNPEEGFTVTAESDKDGNITFLDQSGKPIKLQAGYYTVEETESPKGYKKASDVWKIHVKNDSGKMSAEYFAPQKTSGQFVNDDKSYGESTVNTNLNIKYKSKITHIDPDAKTFVQRIYIDMRGYGGKEKVNLQITPKHKREETDYAPDKEGNVIPPETNKEGLKTAYRTTYKINNPKVDMTENDVNDVLKYYDLSKKNVEMVNTARWRPFGWGFDEDILNLEPGGVYFIDVEGYYDDALITGKATKEIDPDTKKQKDPYDRTDIKPEDLKKLEMDFKFYNGPREFHQAVYNEKTNKIEWKRVDYPKGNFLAGNQALNAYYKANNITGPDGKIKEVSILSREGGKIVPSIEVDKWGGTLKPNATIHTAADISSLYTETKPENAKEIPKDGLDLINEEEVYNITFSKHGRDGTGDEWGDNSKNITDNRLEGAIFKLEKRVGNSNTYEDVPGSYVSSAFNGYFGFRGLGPGRYRLREVKAPKGYRPINEPILYMTIAYEEAQINEITHETITPGRGAITIEYGENNSIVRYAGANASGSGKLVDYVTAATAKNMGKIINERPGKGKVEITKLDENGKLLPGAKFKLTRITSKEAIEPGEKEKPDGIYTGTVDENGKLVFELLPIGQYILQEIETVPGHVLTDQTWQFTVGGNGLDPYIDDNSTGGNDITTSLEIEKSELKVLRPNEDTDQGNNQIRPHIGENLQFFTDFKIKDGTKIKPGDYFTLKLSDNIDLEGVKRGSDDNFNLFADGIGTVAKAKYDKEAGTITYTFTRYAAQYTLEDFSNVLAANITLDKVKNTGWQKVGVGLGKDTSKYKDLYVYYDVDVTRPGNNNNLLGMSSKIVSFNVETGEFVHYIYLNRDRNNTGYNNYFEYQPNVAVNDLKFEYFDLVNNYYPYYYAPASYTTMPASFGVNENDSNLKKIQTVTFGNVEADSENAAEIGTFPSTRSTIVKVSGKVDKEGFKYFKGIAKVYSPYQWYGQTYANYYMHRWDQIFAYTHEADATGKLEISAINPTNKVIFRKMDEGGVALAGAEFYLVKYNEDAKDYRKIEGTDKTSGKDGLVTYEELSPGKYALVEKYAPEGYRKIEGYVVEFEVDKDGKITRESTQKETKEKNLTDAKNLAIQRLNEIGIDSKIYFEPISKAKTIEGLVTLVKELEAAKGPEHKSILPEDFGKPYRIPMDDIPYEVINYKDINFVKVDGDDISKRLANAKFDLYYKEKQDGEYKKLENYKDVIKSDEKGNFSLKISKDGFYALKETKAPAGYTLIPGYIKEFKLDGSKVQVLEKDPLKTSLTKGDGGKLTSEIIKVDKENGTFTQRIIINPNHDTWKFDAPGTYLRFLENGWKNNKEGMVASQTGPLVKAAVLEKGKTLDNLEEKDFNDVVSLNPFKIGDATVLRYPVRSLFGQSHASDMIETNKAIVVEMTGQLDNKNNPVDIGLDLYFDRTTLDELTYKLDLNNLSSKEPVYVDKVDDTPIQVENTKTEYPLTGGIGALIFAIIGAGLMTAAYIGYKRKKVIE